MPAIQTNRFIAIETSLGADVLLLKSFSHTEQLGRLFEIEVELASEKNGLDFDSLVGGNATIRLATPAGTDRFFNGYISRFQQSHQDGNLTLYRAVLVPWLWLLTRTADCRIFQNKTVPDIIEAVFQAQGFNNYQLKLTATYPTSEYCVQYRETDYNFVCRLMEAHGIYFYFEHESGKHTLILADASSAHQEFSGYATCTYQAPGAQKELPERISDWVVERELQATVYALADFNFETPSNPLLVNSSITRSHEAANFEIFDHPGDFSVRPDGETLAQIRIQELQAHFEVARGNATVRGLSAGCKFTLQNHYRSDQNRAYLLTATTLRAAAGEFSSGGKPGADFFEATFKAIPFDQQFRTPRSTPKPMIRGPQTAFVTGTSGEEIYTDQYGRVKVQFPWDRYGQADENSSCWLRVSHAWAGKSWGAIFTPRIGQEVIVEFLEGDPDRPIVTGRVYNAVNTVPYALPAQQTISGTKSNSSKGGNGFNEIRFEDKAGSEQIYIHAQKDVNMLVENDAYETITHDRHLVVKNDQVESVANDRQEAITRDHVEQIGRDHHLTISGKEAIAVTGSHSFKVTGDVIEEFSGNQSTQITGNLYIKGKNVVLEATDNITINVGDSYIAIDTTGIKISTTGDLAIEATKTGSLKTGTDLTVEATATATIKGDTGLTLQSTAQAALKSPNTTVSGDGMVTISGGLVKIN